MKIYRRAECLSARLYIFFGSLETCLDFLPETGTHGLPSLLEVHPTESFFSNLLAGIKRGKNQ